MKSIREWEFIVADPTGFTRAEAVCIHAALMEAKNKIEANSSAIIKNEGRDVYDTVWRNIGTALEKITTMAKAAIEGEGHESE
jgi:hypothetical protein